MNLGSQGMAVTEFPSLARDERSFDLFIFLRDTSEHILPTWERGRDRTRPTVTLVPENEDLTQSLIELLKPFDHGGWAELTELVSSFCDVVASCLVQRGEAYVEVIPGTEISNRPAGLVVLPPWIVRRVPGAYLQFVPKPDRHAIGRRWTCIPAGRILRIELPKSLGSPREQVRLVRHLDRISNRPPHWAVESWGIGAKSTHFDYEAFAKARRLELERTLVRWGSMVYGDNDEKTEYFQISRMLLMFRARAELRRVILGALNRLIAPTGSEARLECRGLPETTEIDDGLAKLWAGELPLSDGLRIAGI